MYIHFFVFKLILYFTTSQKTVLYNMYLFLLKYKLKRACYICGVIKKIEEKKLRIYF